MKKTTPVGDAVEQALAMSSRPGLVQTPSGLMVPERIAKGPPAKPPQPRPVEVTSENAAQVLQQFLVEREIPHTRSIVETFFCSACVAEVDKALAPNTPEADRHVAMVAHQRFEFGVTEIGFQVWCVRHDVNVLHVDLQGVQHRVNARRRALDSEIKWQPSEAANDVGDESHHSHQNGGDL